MDRLEYCSLRWWFARGIERRRLEHSEERSTAVLSCFGHVHTYILGGIWPIDRSLISHGVCQEATHINGHIKPNSTKLKSKPAMPCSKYPYPVPLIGGISQSAPLNSPLRPFITCRPAFSALENEFDEGIQKSSRRRNKLEQYSRRKDCTNPNSRPIAWSKSRYTILRHKTAIESLSLKNPNPTSPFLTGPNDLLTSSKTPTAP